MHGGDHRGMGLNGNRFQAEELDTCDPTTDTPALAYAHGIQLLGRRVTMIGRRSVLAALLMAAVATFAPAASAAQAGRPDHTPNDGFTRELKCVGLGTLTVQATSAGEWFHAAEPRLVVDSTLVLVAYAFRYVDTASNGTVWFDVRGAKPAPKNQRLDVCTMTVPYPEDGGGTGIFVATYWVSYTPGR